MNDEKKISRQRNMRLFVNKYGIVFVFFGMFIILSIVSKKFLTVANLTNVLNTVTLNGVLALGMVFVITAGGIDLSIGAMLALASVTIGLVLQADGSCLMACLAAIAICSLFGFLNGLLITQFKLFPFVVTLASQLVIRGIGYAMSGGYSFALAKPEFTKIGLGKLWGKIPYPIFIFLAVAIAAHLLLHCSKFGRYVFAVGGNINAAIVSGLNVKAVQTLTYVISGFCAGIAGIIITTRINAAQPNIGTGYETDTIAACVIGGTSFSGGIATIPGTIMGILIIGLIYNGMNLVGIESYWQTIAKGLLIIIAVLLDKLFKWNRG